MIFLAMPLLYDILPTISSPIIARGFLTIVLLFGIIRIYNTHFQYTKRLNWYQKTITEINILPNKKVV